MWVLQWHLMHLRDWGWMEMEERTGEGEGGEGRGELGTSGVKANLDR